MNYTESISYLRGTNRAFCKPGTERVEALCAAVGNPQKHLPVIHVAGTNGKGSFCVILASLLKEAGYTVGRFSSPALCKINECVTVNGGEISEEDFARQRRGNFRGRFRPSGVGSATFCRCRGRPSHGI